MTVNADIRKRFLTDTDETGRFIVKSARTGRTYYVEPIQNGKGREWGSIDPATGDLTHKKGDGKYTGAVKEKDSLITEENGFDKVHTLEPGMSPLAYIDHLDAKYPDKV
ncbi:MAG TPA: hypothetical protein VFM18_16750 [Methanosarcina sp.]|nr:hypothetical protein [Methanosarcina sp.]